MPGGQSELSKKWGWRRRPGPCSRRRKRGDAFGELGILRKELPSRAAFIVRIIESRGHGGTKQGKFPTCAKSRALPATSVNNVLRAHARGKVGPQNNLRAASPGMQFQHFDGISQIKMENFVARETMDGGKGVGHKQVIDGRAHRARTRVNGRQSLFGQTMRRFVGTHEVAALAGKRLETKKFANLRGCQFAHEGSVARAAAQERLRRRLGRLKQFVLLLLRREAVYWETAGGMPVDTPQAAFP